MKLIDLLVKELPKRGGWPEGAACVVQDNDGQVCFSSIFEGLTLNRDKTDWLDGSWAGNWSNEFYDVVADDRTTAIVTRAQYEAAIAKNDGWIEWVGGECPVSGDTEVLIKCKSEGAWDYLCKQRADEVSWIHDDSMLDVIAYRLHKPEINSRANDDRLEQDLNECIGQDVDPTWNGDGLPPVGTICEAKVPRSITGWEWREVKVVESGIHGAEKEVLVYDLETTFPSWVDEFRPLRTEAERAREDAETAIRTCLAGTGAGITPLAAKGIYEAIAAGKIPGVKLENK